jgi:hypothetical protein
LSAELLPYYEYTVTNHAGTDVLIRSVEMLDWFLHAAEKMFVVISFCSQAAVKHRHFAKVAYPVRTLLCHFAAPFASN